MPRCYRSSFQIWATDDDRRFGKQRPQQILMRHNTGRRAPTIGARYHAVGCAKPRHQFNGGGLAYDNRAPRIKFSCLIVATGPSGTKMLLEFVFSNVVPKNSQAAVQNHNRWERCQNTFVSAVVVALPPRHRALPDH